jgi:hypothetical protein
MPAVLVVLFVLAVRALLGILAVGLLLTFKTLQSIHGWFEKVLVGVRAVEQQLAPLATGSRVRTTVSFSTSAGNPPGSCHSHLVRCSSNTRLVGGSGGTGRSG